MFVSLWLSAASFGTRLSLIVRLLHSALSGGSRLTRTVVQCYQSSVRGFMRLISGSTLLREAENCAPGNEVWRDATC